MSSSPLRSDASVADQLDWYKTQYTQLEADLADFQASSKELEEQLEKDVETAEKNERKWKEQVEKLNFEVEEWKTKHKQAKTEANNAQNVLQKEITSMRETNRSLQLRLRDTEVMNDDYERQARNTESSLEDMETKYNAAIERGVLLEEEIKLSEQDREALRIEAQRLRDDLGDLKVESDITMEKLRLAEVTIDNLQSRKPAILAVEHLRARSPASDASGFTPLSPTASTPPPKSDTTSSEVQTPPSPPLSDSPTHVKSDLRTPVPFNRTSLAPQSATPRPPATTSRTQPRHIRGPSMASSASTAVSENKSMRPPTSRLRSIRTSNIQSANTPRSESLYQIRGLIGRMQKIEERVHSARSKLPGPNNTTPRNSPRSGSTFSEHIPSSITVRRTTKRPSVSTASSTVHDSTDENSISGTSRRDSHIKRLSYGIPRPSSVATSRSDAPDRSPSAIGRPPSALDRPPSALDRPSSVASINRPPSLRPPSRSSISAAPAVLGESIHRPRSSIGGSYTGLTSTPRTHRLSASISELRRAAAESEEGDMVGGMGGGTVGRPSLSRRTTLDKSGLPMPGTLTRRQSGGLGVPRPVGKRVSGAFSQAGDEEDGGGGGGGGGVGEMRPPPRKRTTDVGETY